MMFLAPPCASIPGRQPSRTYYQVLGVSPDEQDPRVIEEAAVGCSSHARAYQLACESECTPRLNEIAQALVTLLDPVRRREYDRGLGRSSSPARSECRPPGKQDPVLLRGKSSLPAWGEGPRLLIIGDEEPCDVKLVYRAVDPAKGRSLAGLGGRNSPGER